MPPVRYFQPAPSSPSDQKSLKADLCVYGATAAGIMAAVQARRMGLSVVLAHPGTHIGGMTTGGLGFTDFGNKGAIGGLAREFYVRVGAHYGKPVEYCFEPKVATAVLNGFLLEAGLETVFGYYVDSVLVGRDASQQLRIKQIEATNGRAIAAAYFIDCSYEGDLLARTDVKYSIGREPNREFRETYNGQQLCATHQFDRPIDPYVTPGDATSGLLPGVAADSTFLPGQGDNCVQAYNFRVCMTDVASNRVPFPKPPAFDPGMYEVLFRWLSAGGGREAFVKFDRIQGGKTDTNNHGAFSTDFIGGGYGWPRGTYQERERLFQAHVDYQQGYHWVMANDSRVPVEIRRRYGEWGLASDEFGDTDHWPHQLYVREARRMRGAVVMTQNHCLGLEAESDVVGLAAYGMDSHNCRRVVINGLLLNEGDVQIKLPRPYGISYRAITPKASECVNLLVPVCLSATHIAYGSIRMEPVFMVLAQSAATAAAIAFQEQCRPVQDVTYAALQRRLRKDGQVLDTSAAPINPATGNEDVPDDGPLATG